MRLRNVKNANEMIINGKYFISNPQDYKNKWQKLFNNDNPIYLEIGIGKGKFIIDNAYKYPNINFIGIEKFDSVLVRAIQKSNDLDLNNLKIIRLDARLIEEIFDHEINLIYLNFSDPWPKDRHSKRRLTSSNFLIKYDNIFKNDKTIIMKTDNIDLFNYSYTSLKEYGYKITYLTNNLKDKDNITTEYEEKFVKLGIKINKLIAKKYQK